MVKTFKIQRIEANLLNLIKEIYLKSPQQKLHLIKTYKKFPVKTGSKIRKFDIINSIQLCTRCTSQYNNIKRKKITKVCKGTNQWTLFAKEMIMNIEKSLIMPVYSMPFLHDQRDPLRMSWKKHRKDHQNNRFYNPL